MRRDDIDWKQAHCYEHPEPDIWFALDYEPDHARAKAICGMCPLKEPCLVRGLNEAFGIWGGMNPKERQAWVKAYRKPA